MVDLAYDWNLMGWGMRAIVIALAIALVIVVLSPHIASLKPVAERLGLIQTTTETVYVPINHTVYVNRTIYVNQTIIKYINQTVPVYINRTVYVTVGSNMSYFESYAGYCSGRLVILPNNTAWIVWFWLAPKAYIQSPYLYNYFFEKYAQLLYYNSTMHYAQFFAPTIMNVEFLSLQGLTLKINFPWCIIDNITIGNYYILACGDTGGHGPIAFFSNTFIRNSTGMWETGSFVLPVVGNLTALNYLPIRNATYTGVMIIPYQVNGQTINTLGPFCDLAITFVSNATAALWLPVTMNQTLINYWSYADELTLGHYDEYDYTMGYWVWNYPS